MFFLSVCICEDIQFHADDLKRIIDAWSKKSNVEIHYTCYYNPFEFEAEDVIKSDIVFMDIELGEFSGIDIAKNIRALGSQMPIVFVTGYKKYIYECHGIMALDFLEKPVDQEYCEICLNRALETCVLADKSCVLIGKKKFFIDSVLYIEAQGHATIIHLLQSQVKLAKDFSEVVALFSHQQIVETHRSYAVNVKYIFHIDSNEVILDNAVAVPLSRCKVDFVSKSFFEHIGARA